MFCMPKYKCEKSTKRLINQSKLPIVMAYDQDFYNAYNAYLKEGAVRSAHDKIFKIARLNKDFDSVIDLGCGLFNEFLVHAKPYKYAGIDLNVDSAKIDKGIHLINGNYRRIHDFEELIRLKQPASFTSLFSSEITSTPDRNYALYQTIFDTFDTINSGLVSGFYYVSKKGQNPIVETGDIESYQTLEDIEDVISHVFEEQRIILPVPSKMFGQDVYEVWKFFSRKQLIRQT